MHRRSAWYTPLGVPCPLLGQSNVFPGLEASNSAVGLISLRTLGAGTGRGRKGAVCLGGNRYSSYMSLPCQLM